MASLRSELGNRYGRLTVVERAANQGTRARWVCQCDCGETVTVIGKNLRNGHTSSCGCFRKEVTAERGRNHKMPEAEARRRCLKNGFELLSEYKGILSKAKFKCTTCGYTFERKADSSIYGLWGCERCSKSHYDFNRAKTIKTDSDYANKKAIVYLMKFESGGESFYKVGYTTQALKERIRKIPYVLVGVEYVKTTVARAYELELQFKNAIKPFRYRPRLPFGGCAECFQPAPQGNTSSTVSRVDPAR